MRRKHIAEGKISARGRTEAPAQGAGRKAKEGEKDKPLQRVEEEALQREPQDIVEYLREQGICLRQLTRKLEQNETIFL